MAPASEPMLLTLTFRFRFRPLGPLTIWLGARLGRVPSAGVRRVLRGAGCIWLNLALARCVVVAGRLDMGDARADHLLSARTRGLGPGCAGKFSPVNLRLFTGAQAPAAAGRPGGLQRLLPDHGPQAVQRPHGLRLLLKGTAPPAQVTLTAHAEHSVHSASLGGLGVQTVDCPLVVASKEKQNQ